MPTFDTPGPIEVKLSLLHGDVRITATGRADTAVEVRPRSGDPRDVRAAEQTTVDFSGHRLEIHTLKTKRGLLEKLAGGGFDGAVDVTIELPEGSSLHGESAMGLLRAEGRLGTCAYKTAAGDIELDHTGALRLETALGLVRVGRAAGRVEASTAHGRVHIDEIDGNATVKNLSGPIEIGGVTGDARLTGVNGDIVVDRARADVEAKTANGNLRIGEVSRGSVTLETAAGSIEVGVRAGTAAHLDVHALVGSVHNGLTSAAGPGGATNTVKVRARTHLGSIEIRRAGGDGAAP
jgi:DUF4097 and DUF4098 domain-containing protein YvlB